MLNQTLWLAGVERDSGKLAPTTISKKSLAHLFVLFKHAVAVFNALH